jgi:hypothetical protein
MEPSFPEALLQTLLSSAERPAILAFNNLLNCAE